MTILTKALSGEKKGDKLVVPLVDNDQLATAPRGDVEGGQGGNVVILRTTRVRRISISTTCCLVLTALLVMCVGILVGKHLYHQYISNEMRLFRGSAQFPMGSVAHRLYQSGDLSQSLDEDDAEYLREGFEIDIDRESYEKIDVPDFKDGRSGRFIHDFNTNITGIIDSAARRCFVMPLNRGTVLPPKSLFDLIHKMLGGYYQVDTQVVRKTMRVVTPAIKDLDSIGPYIAKECENRPIYQLEKYVGGVVKRSASLEAEAKFAQFSGKKITEIDIVNMDDVIEYEKSIQ